MSTFDVPYAMKCMAWEEAKAGLRKLVALQGSHHGQESYQLEKLKTLKAEVDAFVDRVENNALNE